MPISMICAEKIHPHYVVSNYLILTIKRSVPFRGLSAKGEEEKERREEGEVLSEGGKRYQGERGPLHHPSHSQQRFGQRIERSLQRGAEREQHINHSAGERREDAGAGAWSENCRQEQEGAL